MQAFHLSGAHLIRCSATRSSGPVTRRWVPIFGVAALLALPFPTNWNLKQESPAGDRRYRWPVKTVADRDAGRIQWREFSTVTALAAAPRPARIASNARRIGPIELTIYTVRARLLFYSLEEDGDYHMVLEDPADKSQTMIAEIPDPRMIGLATPLARGIIRARDVFRARWEPTRQRKNGERVLVEISGVGFFDKRHNVLGAAENGVELHPVTEVHFLDR